IRKTVLADFKSDMGVVCTASGVPSTMIPRQSLVCGNRAVSQLANKGMNADLSATGMIGIPMIVILIFAEQTIIGTDITLEVWVIGTSGMDHDTLNRNFPACLITGIFR